MYAPEHYQQCTIKYELELQPIDAIRKLPFSLACAIKYLCRAGHKGAASADLRKALDYLDDYHNNFFDDQNDVCSYTLDTKSMVAIIAFAKVNKNIDLLFSNLSAVDEFNNDTVFVYEDDLENAIEHIQKALEDVRDE